MADGQDLHIAAFDAVDYTVVADKNLADVVTVQFADGAAGFGEVFQLVDGIENIIFPAPSRKPILAFVGNVADALVAAENAALGPFDHSPSSLLMRSRSASASLLASACVRYSPRSSSDSAAATSLTSSRYSR